MYGNVTNITRQIRELQLSLSQPCGQIFYESSAVVFSLAVGFYSSWQLTLVILATFPVAGAVLWLVSRSLTSAIEAQKRDLTSASRCAITAITAISTIKVVNGQNQEVWQYYNVLAAVAKEYLIQARANSMQSGVIKFFTVGLFVQGFWYGLHLVRGGTGAGNIVTTFYACLSAIQAAEVILPQWLVLSKGISAGATLQAILQEARGRSWQENQTGGTQPDSLTGRIEMVSVSSFVDTGSWQRGYD